MEYFVGVDLHKFFFIYYLDIDAKTLCRLLRGNLIPESYIAGEDIQDNRALSRARISLVHDQTMLKNRVIAIFTKGNLKFEGTDTFGTKG